MSLPLTTTIHPSITYQVCNQNLYEANYSSPQLYKRGIIYVFAISQSRMRPSLVMKTKAHRRMIMVTVSYKSNNQQTFNEEEDNLPSDSIAIRYLFHSSVFPQEVMIGPNPKLNFYRCLQDKCAKPLFLSGLVTLWKVHLLVQALPARHTKHIIDTMLLGKLLRRL